MCACSCRCRIKQDFAQSVQVGVDLKSRSSRLLGRLQLAHSGSGPIGTRWQLCKLKRTVALGTTSSQRSQGDRRGQHNDNNLYAFTQLLRNGITTALPITSMYHREMGRALRRVRGRGRRGGRTGPTRLPGAVLPERHTLRAQGPHAGPVLGRAPRAEGVRRRAALLRISTAPMAAWCVACSRPTV